MSDAALTGASIPLTLGSVRLEMHPLTDRDIVELDEYVRSRIMDTFFSTCPKELQADLLPSALRTASGTSWMSGEGARMMATVEGVTQMLWQSTKKTNKTTSRDEMRRLMFDSTNVLKVREQFRRINDIVAGEKKVAENESQESDSTKL